MRRCMRSGQRRAKRAVVKKVAGTCARSRRSRTRVRPAAPTANWASSGIGWPYSRGTSNSSASKLRRTRLVRSAVIAATQGVRADLEEGAEHAGGIPQELDLGGLVRVPLADA